MKRVLTAHVVTLMLL